MPMLCWQPDEAEVGINKWFESATRARRSETHWQNAGNTQQLLQSQWHSETIKRAFVVGQRVPSPSSKKRWRPFWSDNNHLRDSAHLFPMSARRYNGTRALWKLCVKLSVARSGRELAEFYQGAISWTTEQCMEINDRATTSVFLRLHVCGMLLK